MKREYDVYVWQLAPPNEESIKTPELTYIAKNPGPPSLHKRCDTLAAARAFADQHKRQYNRITIHVASPTKPTLVERYNDGTRLVIKEEAELDAEEKAASDEKPNAQA